MNNIQIPGTNILLGDVLSGKVDYPFQGYESKPITRQAFQISQNMRVSKTSVEAMWECHVVIIGDADTGIGRTITFKAYEEPKVGDWIVRLTEADTYHCTDAVFRERNIVNSDY